jgi:endonuclease/exonuclease/phosphatase family metal-dependent hydrolase
MRDGDWRTGPSAAQYAIVRVGKSQCAIVNVHGLSAWPKSDTPERIEQSRRIAGLPARAPSARIICGDFNLLPDTESMRILEHGMENLITKFSIASTRSSLHKLSSSFSDYMLVSPTVEVLNFSVSNIEVSDHLPMIMDFNFV